MNEYGVEIEPSKNVRLGDYFPIDYSEESSIRIKRYLEKHYVPLLPYQAKDLTPEELNHLNYLILSLNAFFAQDNKFHTKREKLIPIIMSIDGPKYLKRFRLKSFLTSSGDSLIEKPDWWDDIPSIFIEDIGEIYNFNYSMFWNAPDENDYLLSQTPVVLDNEIVKQFTKFVYDFIGRRDDFEYIKEDEILFRVSSSKALYGGKSVPHYSAKSKCMYFSKKRSAGKRCFITPSPGSGRDAIINNIEDLNTIQLINENVRMFLEKNFRKHLLLGNAEASKKRYFRACKKSKGFYCRDIKKEGITKPKWLIKLIINALHKRYPDCTAFHYPEFFDGPWYEGDIGDRGHGLGMANELTTLMQILIFYFTNWKSGEDGYYINATRAFFLNDDAVVFFDEDFEWAFEDFVDIDFEVCNALGIMASKDKSFISRISCVFCEMYYTKNVPTINNKQSYILREESIILRSGSILESKMLLGSMKGSLKQVEEILLKTYSLLGYEFSRDELRWPISFGGCRPHKLRGTDFSLISIQDESDIKTIFKAFEANKCRRMWNFNKYIKTYKNPLLNYYPHLLKEEDSNLLSKLGICSDYEYACMFFRPTKEHKFHNSIEKLYNKRQKIFKSIDTYPTFESLCENYSQNSLSNVAVLDHQIERTIPVHLFVWKDFKDPYKVKNPLSSYLNTLDRTDKTIPATSWGLYSTDASLLHEKSVFARIRTNNTLSLIDRFEEDLDIEILVFPKNKEDIPVFMEAYPKPFLTYELVERGDQLRIPYQRFWNPELYRRLGVYQRYLEFHHIKLAQTRTWLELMWIIEFEQKFPQYEYNYEVWMEIFDIYHSKINKSGSSSEEGSESDQDKPDDDDVFRNPLDKRSPNVVIIFNDDIRTKIESKESSTSEEEEEIFTVEEPINIFIEIEKKIDDELNEKIKNNPFMKAHGPLPSGGIDVYGSEEWIKWFVREGPLEIDEYCENDEDLAFASADMISFKRRINTVSDIANTQNESLKNNVRTSAEKSWIAHYFVEWIDQKDEEPEPTDYDLFG